MQVWVAMDSVLDLDGGSWTIGAKLGEGGYGKVFRASSDKHPDAVAKFIPRDPGADRELLFVDLSDVRNVVPILDIGSTEDSWVLVMPRAEHSLHDYLEGHTLPLDVAEAKEILTDIATTLVDLVNRKDPVVHRDVKPKNVLWLNNAWCLADFGVSRYAEATTASNTLRDVFSQSYASPEQWNLQRATEKADIYALGVVAYYLLSGQLPFPGPNRNDFREQHLHQSPATLANVPVSLASLISRCLYKAPGSRPSAAEFIERLARVDSSPVSPGRLRLQQADLAEVTRNAEAERIQSEQRTERERRESLERSAREDFKAISADLRRAVEETASTATVSNDNMGGWVARLGGATLDFAPMQTQSSQEWNHWKLGFDVIAYGSVSLTLPTNNYNYKGRGHSLWYCDVMEEGEYAWYEVGFMDNVMMKRQSNSYPYALRPGEDSAKALSQAITEYDVGRRFMRLVPGDIERFVDYWLDIFGQAASGSIPMPDRLPDGERGSWRRSPI